MKWRESQAGKGAMWYTGPTGKRYTARKGGKRYEVVPEWQNWLVLCGPVVWWSSDGLGNNKRWATVEEAKAWCERDAGGET